MPCETQLHIGADHELHVGASRTWPAFPHITATIGGHAVHLRIPSPREAADLLHAEHIDSDTMLRLRGVEGLADSAFAALTGYHRDEVSTVAGHDDRLAVVELALAVGAFCGGLHNINATVRGLGMA